MLWINTVLQYLMCMSSSPGAADSDSLTQSLSDGEEQERQQQAELTRTTCMSQWRAGAVQAWLDLVLGMPMYSRACAENVKSGKVLLGLTDDDLEHGLGIGNVLHRRKLRLAIEDYRRAEGDHGLGLSKASDLDHHWVCSSWLCDVGLPQYSQVFLAHLIDGRVLNSLNRRDLERHLNISEPFHQTSLLLGIQLLQMLSFDRETLQARRSQCEQLVRDPIVWTCQRVMKWVRDIDLKEFADNLQGKGVHGAVLVLDPSFDPEAMSKALCVPTNRPMLLRHLYEEMKALTAPHGTFEPGSASSSPVIMNRFANERKSMRRSGKSPLRLRGSSHSAERARGLRQSSPGSCGSSPREGRAQAGSRGRGSPMHTYTSVEITNV